MDPFKPWEEVDECAEKHQGTLKPGVGHFIRVASNKQRSLPMDFRGLILVLYVKVLGPWGPNTFVVKMFWYLVNPIFGRQKTLINI